MNPLSFALCVAVLCTLAGTAGAAPPPCSSSSDGWCLERRFPGEVPNGELGFRFGEPLDVDGDGRADLAAGSRWKLHAGLYQNGIAALWSGATGAKLREWDGQIDKGMFGHSVLPLPDLDGDALADVVIAAPHAEVEGTQRGVLSARSPKTGEVLWRHIAKREERLGWDLARAGDQDGDGLEDIFAGAPSSDGGRAFLLSGRDGSVLRVFQPEAKMTSFGWYVAKLDDFDGDGRGDLGVCAFMGEDAPDFLGAVFVYSSNTTALLRRWDSPDKLTAFGEVVAGIGDLDGDGRGEVVISAAGSADMERRLEGEVIVYSGATGKELRRWKGKQPGEHFGRMLVGAGDIDGDGAEDVAIGAPWHRVGDADRTGRVEIRSGRSGEVLAEWFGEGAEHWFGWHIRRAPDPSGGKRPALLIGSLRAPRNGEAGTGFIDLYVNGARRR